MSLFFSALAIKLHIAELFIEEQDGRLDLSRL